MIELIDCLKVVVGVNISATRKGYYRTSNSEKVRKHHYVSIANSQDHKYSCCKYKNYKNYRQEKQAKQNGKTVRSTPIASATEYAAARCRSILIF